ncbi:glycolate oxidase subunit GlcE [Microbulbifer thermotolerans]|uniref:glycolate oxidase subunit GlcE n=1 Tax=Microbulbifer thermotolerans TaxID=252514 RepID=UPI0008E0FC9A|nr:glycolate oxidase subunit GlcE [Microbulbifer thermotolerans]MCX2780643.1 glycolate oxidase subunit GlcE [Microbulbifer thermotolerans]MCX2783720.1 glycolate oxidase subunit GlcE [Microbulbifer thermotolerans]MCX2795358.1 glycolate oxidase subunit GlcE [Microbulbifer thermotolerans]MCX2806184.1 glycolate oxidase subunit GlcE [Microbulbifer thermotolerans]MCX2841272.1 glycolate oxidase subunit GlcE [Microbulbifer thermotolerans]
MADIFPQLQEQVLQAREDGRKLNIIGGGTKAFMGRPVDPNTDILNLAEHTGVVEYHPVELVLTVRAGTPLREIEATLAEQGQALHFEPPRLGENATIGGTLACNLSGPARPWAGSIRDQVLGIRLLNGKGEHLRFGGQVMKNVAGYDVSRLQAGAMGTLGVITEISLKVMPQPAATLTLVQDMAPGEVIQYMNSRAAEPKPITGACWVDGKVYLRLSGARSAVEATAEKWSGKILEQGEQFWQQIRDLQHGFFTATNVPLWRFSISATAPQPKLEGEWLIDWAGAQRWYRGEGQMMEMEALAAAAGGQVSLFRGGDRSGEVMHRQPEALKTIQQRIKNAFDPDHLFNPGRLYSWL